MHWSAHDVVEGLIGRLLPKGQPEHHLREKESEIVSGLGAS